MIRNVSEARGYVEKKKTACQLPDADSSLTLHWANVKASPLGLPVFCRDWDYSPLGDSVTAGMECILGSAMYLKSTGMSLGETTKKKKSHASVSTFIDYRDNNLQT